jgi:hypothetical protein
MGEAKRMQGYKLLLGIEGSPRLAIFELRDGRYWDGERATVNGTTTPMPDGFYVCELGDDDGFITTVPERRARGPYTTAADAERVTRKTMAHVDRSMRDLERAGLVRRKVGADGVARCQVVTLPSQEEADRVWERLTMEYGEDELAGMVETLHEMSLTHKRWGRHANN